MLDVDCFRGDFLGSLGACFPRFGIELNSEAAGVATSRGIDMIGSTAEDDFSRYAQTFGAIILIDVIEHLTRPRDVRARMQELLVPGGLIILLSGNYRSWPMRLSLPRYWSMRLPTHLVLLGSRHVTWLCKESDLELL